MGNTQAGSDKGALAKFYAANGADISRVLVHMGKTSYAQPLCDVLGIPYTPAVQGAVQGGMEGMFGGGESFVGGFDDLQNYGNSMYSKAKEKLIRVIAEDVLTALKAKNVKNVRNAPIQDVVAHLTKALPPNLTNPRKFHENFNKSSSAQREVCKALATAINKHYAGALIDVDGDESAMCNKIAEIMYSLLTGLHTEFMNVAGDAMRVMNNMQLANEYLERAYKKQKELIDQSADARLKNQSSETDKVYEEVKAEYNRQAAILDNLMNIAVGPTGKSLISSLEDNRDFVGLVKNLKAMVGTQAFGDKLSYLLSGISSVAHSAELIDKALKKIGMSVVDFKSSKSAGELRGKVLKHIMSKNPSSKQLDEMMAAAKVIYEANYDHDSISKALDGKSKRGGDASGGYDSDGGSDNMSDGGSDDNVMGGAADDDGNLTAYWQRKSLKKKIDNKKKYREIVLKDFRKQLKQQLRSIVDAANEISRHIGNGIPVDDNLKQFVETFAMMPSLDQENIHLALSGYPKDSTSKEQRDLFMNKYFSVLKAIEPLTKGPQGNLFKDVHKATEAMIHLIDEFSDKMVKALTEIHIDSPEDVAQALKRTASTFYGAGDSGDDMFGDGSWVAFDKVKNEMAYYYSIAHVKTNLARSHDDLQSYAEDYEQILGEESAWVIDRIKRQYLDRIEKIDPKVPAPVGTAGGLAAIWNDLHASHAANPAPITIEDDSKSAAEWALVNLKSLWSFQMNAKVNMVKAAQAVDLYMKAFTDGIAKNPDSLSSIVKMLNEVELVAKWFNDRSGDQFATLFDIFPSGMNGEAPAYLDTKDSNVDAKGNVRIPSANGYHYYEYVEVQNAAGNLPGNPFLGRPLSGNHTTNKQCLGIITLSQKVIKSMRALENIISAFSRVGSKFGSVELLSKTFMTPGQLFNALCEYVAASSLTHEFLPNLPGFTAAVYNGNNTRSQHGADSVPSRNAGQFRAQTGGNLAWSHNMAFNQNSAICKTSVAAAPLSASMGSTMSSPLSASLVSTTSAPFSASTAGPVGSTSIPLPSPVGSTTGPVPPPVGSTTAPLPPPVGSTTAPVVRSPTAINMGSVSRAAKLTDAENASIVAKINSGWTTLGGSGPVTLDTMINTDLPGFNAELASFNAGKPYTATTYPAGVLPDLSGEHKSLVTNISKLINVLDKITTHLGTLPRSSVWDTVKTVIPRERDVLDKARQTVMGQIVPGAGSSPAGSRPIGMSVADLAARRAAMGFSTVGGAESALSVSGHGILTGVANNANSSNAKKSMAVALAAIPSTSVGCDSRWKYHNSADAGTEDLNKVRLDMAGWRDNFFDTDLLFQMTVKSIVAKIFTVVDAYRLFHRPVSDRRAHYSLNPLRSILGGADGGEDGGADGGALMTKVKIIPEALELYYRLILLAEWYRENFGMESTPKGLAREASSNDSWRVTIVPAIDGIWSELVEIIFDRAEYVKDGNYTETQCQRLILAMNDIWKSYKNKYPKSTTRSILNAFVLEMNRTFGFLRQSDIRAYLEDRRDNLKNSEDYNTTENFLDYDILNAEDSFGARPAPSDRFSTVSASNTSKKSAHHMIFLQEAIETLRKKIDVSFLKVTQNDDDRKKSFQESLKHYHNDLANAKSDADEYKVVLRMLQGANRYINQSADKLIMVHEMVAAPLAVLYNVYVMLSKFNALCHGVSLGANAEPGNAGNVSKWNASGATVNATAAAYANFLVNVYQKIPNVAATDMQLQMFAGTFANYLVGVPNVPIQTSAIDSEKLATDLISVLSDFAANPSKLVTINIGATGAINLDFSALEEECRDLLHMVKENIKKLRDNFKPVDFGIVDKYEDFKQIGSTRWLEENMFQKLFADRDRSGLAIAVSHLRNTFSALCANPQVSATGANGAVGDPAASYNSLDGALRQIISYRPNAGLGTKRYAVSLAKYPGNVISLLKNPDSNDEKSAVAKAGSENLNANEVTAFNRLHPAPIILFDDEASINSFDLSNAKSLMVALNKVLHMYLYNSVEDGSNKFYAPIIETFATSAGSLEVMQRKGFPNVLTYSSSSGDPADPSNGPVPNLLAPNEAVIYTSNAAIIRSLMNSVISIGTSQRKRFLYDSLAEVPEYLKERLRVNLPFFSKLFTMIADRAMFLKTLLLNTNLQKNIHAVDSAGLTGNPTAVDADALLNRNAAPASELSATYYSKQLSRIHDCAQSLRRCADTVYRELNDKPGVFFELGRDFLVEYRTRYGGYPVMPFSSVLAPMSMFKANYDANNLLLPVRENGSNVYKFNYSTRLLMTKPDLDPNMEHFAGAKELYNAYNSTAGRNVALSPAEYSSTIKHTFLLGRFLINGMSDNRLLQVGPKCFANNNPGGNPLQQTVFQLVKSFSDVVEITENNTLNISKSKLAKVIGDTSSDQNIDRNRMQVLNILDAGIVPLNVHAFMREVPFVNLFNYSYTFDRMIQEFLLPDYISNKLTSGLSENNLMIQPDEKASTTRELFVKLLMHPYANLKAGSEYFHLAASLFNGNDDFKLSRPRYLSDQLWHKVLLTSSAELATGQLSYSDGATSIDPVVQEAGPQAYEAIRSVVKHGTFNRATGNLSGSTVGIGSSGTAMQAVDTQGLKVWKGGKWQVADPARQMKQSDVLYCAELGKMRFDTRLVRNLVWFVQLQRIMRAVLTNHLSWLNTPVVRGLKITDPKITEFEGNENFDDKDFTGEKYSVL